MTLIIGPIQLISADHLEPGLGIFKNEKAINTISTEDSKYQIYVRVEIRNVQGELISITETTRGIHIAHEITDYTFNEKLGEKEIIVIDNIKYEKVQFSTSSDNPWLFDVYDRELTGIWEVEICGEPIKKYGYECTKIFWTRTGLVFLEVNDVTTANWTILRELN